MRETFFGGAPRATPLSLYRCISASVWDNDARSYRREHLVCEGRLRSEPSNEDI